MKKSGMKRMFCAWLLLVTLVPCLLFKAFHCHELSFGIEEDHSSELIVSTAYSSSDLPDCPICHFFFSPFVYLPFDLNVFRWTVFLSFVCIAGLSIVIREKCGFCLRAPPVPNDLFFV